MYTVSSNNVIKMTRGDTMSLNVVLYEGDVIYEPEVGDTIRFALKRNQLNVAGSEYTDQAPLILKTIPTDTMKLVILPTDTKDLGFGEYVYDVELRKADGTVDTFIPAAKFFLLPEVH